MRESTRISDLSKALTTPLIWEVDPEDVGWLRAEFEGEHIFLRINNFPDRNLYSLWLGGGRYLELDDMPAAWTRSGPLEWPSTARPPRHLLEDDW